MRMAANPIKNDAISFSSGVYSSVNYISPYFLIVESTIKSKSDSDTYASIFLTNGSITFSKTCIRVFDNAPYSVLISIPVYAINPSTITIRKIILIKINFPH